MADERKTYCLIDDEAGVLVGPKPGYRDCVLCMLGTMGSWTAGSSQSGCDWCRRLGWPCSLGEAGVFAPGYFEAIP